MRLAHCGKFKGKSRALILALAPSDQAAVVGVHRGLRNGKPQAEATELSHRIGLALFKGIENSSQELGNDANTCVRYLDHNLPILVVRLNKNLSSFGSKLDRILDQIPEDLLQTGKVAHHKALLCGQLQAEAKILCLNIGLASLQRLLKRDVDIQLLELEFDFVPRNSRQIEQVLDEARFDLDVALDHVERIEHIVGKAFLRH